MIIPTYKTLIFFQGSKVDESKVDDARNRKITFNENAEVILKPDDVIKDHVINEESEDSSSSSDDETAL